MNKKDLKRYIPAQLKLAKKLGLDIITDIQLSPSRTHKYQVTLTDGKKINYGAFGMSDFLIHGDEDRRRRFHQRFRGNKGYNDPYSGLFYSRWLLW